MEDTTWLWLVGGGIAAWIGYRWFEGEPIVPVHVLPAIVVASTGGTSNTVSTPATTVAPSASAQATIQAIAANNGVASQGTIASGVSQADIQSLINSPVLTSLTSAQQNAMTNQQMTAFSNNQQVLLAKQQSAMSSGLPSVIDPAKAGAILGVSQSFINGLKMGSSIGTPFGTFSLQPAGFVTIDKVNVNSEQDLVTHYGSLTWSQYKGLQGLSGLGNFILSF